MKVREFYIELKLWPEEEAAKIPDYRTFPYEASSGTETEIEVENGNEYNNENSRNRKRIALESGAQIIEIITLDDNDNDNNIRERKKNKYDKERQTIPKRSEEKSKPAECLKDLIPPELSFIDPNLFRYNQRDDSVSCSSTDSDSYEMGN